MDVSCFRCFSSYVAIMKEQQWFIGCGAMVFQTSEGLRIAICHHDPDRTVCIKCKEIVKKTGLFDGNHTLQIGSIMEKIIYD